MLCLCCKALNVISQKKARTACAFKDKTSPAQAPASWPSVVISFHVCCFPANRKVCSWEGGRRVRRAEQEVDKSGAGDQSSD